MSKDLATSTTLLCYTLSPSVPTRHSEAIHCTDPRVELHFSSLLVLYWCRCRPLPTSSLFRKRLRSQQRLSQHSRISNLNSICQMTNWKRLYNSSCGSLARVCPSKQRRRTGILSCESLLGAEDGGEHLRKMGREADDVVDYAVDCDSVGP